MENHEGHDHAHEGHDHTGHDHAVAANGKATDRERVLGAISYIGPLFVVSYLMAENSKFIKFHASQGLVFFLAAIVVKFVLGAIMMAVFIPTAIVGGRYGAFGMMGAGYGLAGSIGMVVMLAIIVAAIMGIVKAAQGEEWEMPVIGKWAKKMQL